MGMVVTPIIDKSFSKVLLCYHNKQNTYNFVGGHIEEFENFMDASYRELQEETGITSDDVTLKFLMSEQVTMYDGTSWLLYVSYGILNKSINKVHLREEANRLYWFDINDPHMSEWGFDGDLALYLRRIIVKENKETLGGLW